MKPFARQGHYTAVDNTIFDELMRELSGNEFKLLMAIIRGTVGFQQEFEAISLSDFQALTGIASRNTVVNNLRSLEQRGLVLRRDDGYRVSYALNRAYEMEDCAVIEQSENQHGTATVLVDGTATVPNLVQPSYQFPYIEKKEKKREKKSPHPDCPKFENPEEEALACHPLTHALLDAGFGWPGYRMLAALVAEIGDEALDVAALETARQRWLMHGYNPGNYAGILEWYRNVVNDPAWMPARPGKNGRAPAPTADKAPATQLAGSW